MEGEGLRMLLNRSGKGSTTRLFGRDEWGKEWDKV